MAEKNVEKLSVSLRINHKNDNIDWCWLEMQKKKTFQKQITGKGEL